MKLRTASTPGQLRICYQFKCMPNVAALTLILTAFLAPAFCQTGPEWFQRGYDLHEAHKGAAARDAFQHAVALNYRAPFSMVMVARSYAAEGDTKNASVWLDKAAAAGFAMIGMLETEPAFVAYKGQPWFEKARAKVSSNARPCLAAPEYGQFDFWLGQWDVQVNGKVTARSRIEKIADGCIVQENWMPYAGVEGKSWNFYNAAAKQWEQVWMSAGRVLKLHGGLRDGAMRLTGETPQPGGGPAIQERLTYTPLPQKRVRQLWEQSRDGGKTWTVNFDGAYLPHQ